MTNYLFSTVKQARCGVTITPEKDSAGADMYIVATKPGNITTTSKYYSTTESLITNTSTLATEAILQPAQSGGTSPPYYILTDVVVDRFEDFNG